MSHHLQNGENFPRLEIPAIGGGILNLPFDLAGSFGVVLIYRGHWCPFCNEQMAAFAKASEAFAAENIKVVAFSVDDEAVTREFITRHNVPFSVGHSADLETVVEATGAYETVFPARGHFLETTGFVLAPDGTIVNATYSSRAIGRLTPGDVIRLVAFMKSQEKPVVAK